MKTKSTLYSLGIVIELTLIGLLSVPLLGCGGAGGSAGSFIEQTICVEEIQTDEDTICIQEITEIIPVVR